MDQLQRIESFRNGKLEFEVVDSGPIEGDIVVFLHGFPQTASAWFYVAEYLHELGYRTIIPMQRGYSENARPRSRFSYRATKLESDLAALIKELGTDAVHLVGHDWGAWVAWSFAADYPEQVRTLTTVSVPHPAAFIRSLFNSDQAIRTYFMFLFQIPWVPELMMRVCPEHLDRMLLSARMSLSDRDRAHEEVIDRKNFSKTFHWCRAMFLRFPWEHSRKVKAPTTHVWGSNDNKISWRGVELTERYTSGPYRLEILSGATHWIPEQDPSRLGQIIAERIKA
ncbi:MAG: alpha/beta fold hydrolase [Mycobacteriaceae bacterium]